MGGSETVIIQQISEAAPVLCARGAKSHRYLLRLGQQYTVCLARRRARPARGACTGARVTTQTHKGDDTLSFYTVRIADVSRVLEMSQ